MEGRTNKVLEAYGKAGQWNSAGERSWYERSELPIGTGISETTTLLSWPVRLVKVRGRDVAQKPFDSCSHSHIKAAVDQRIHFEAT